MKHLILLLVLIFPIKVKAGAESFTVLDKIGKWTIERKVSSSGNKINCRASILNYYAWFSGRIHLDRNDQVVIPAHISEASEINDEDIGKLVKALKACRESLYYVPVE